MQQDVNLHPAQAHGYNPVPFERATRAPHPPSNLADSATPRCAGGTQHLISPERPAWIMSDLSLPVSALQRSQTSSR